jgi:mono/diheme cytochrome c family protein
MQKSLTGLSLLAAFVFLAAAAVPCYFASEAQARNQLSAPAKAASILHEKRVAPSDLEVGGELAGLASGTTRYITREDLLVLPQASYTVTDDSNFVGPARVGGVLLEELIRHLGAAPESDLLIAICDDLYRTNYSRAYILAHHPLLVLTVNGQPPAGWPKDSEGHGFDMGPYMISHPQFTPGFKILSHADEPQIPWGVVRLEFRDEKAVFGAIAPRGPHAADSPVQAGYRIAQQNCFRCHNLGSEGGQKAARTWQNLSAWATASPEYFAAYVRNPAAKNPHAQMPGNPAYDDATLQALTAYFQTFSSSEKP